MKKEPEVEAQALFLVNSSELAIPYLTYFHAYIVYSYTAINNNVTMQQYNNVAVYYSHKL